MNMYMNELKVDILFAEIVTSSSNCFRYVRRLFIAILKSDHLQNIQAT